jgi:hypothetical protein
MMNKITNETPLAVLTLGQFKEALKECQPVPVSPPETNPTKKYVYGLRGIRQLFGVSHATAQRYKDTVIRDAVRQNGRKIIVDADKAIELFNRKTGGRR